MDAKYAFNHLKNVDFSKLSPRELDELVSIVVMECELYVREVYVCPACGWETDSLEESSRCQACLGNGIRQMMSDDKIVMYDFHPSTDIASAWQVLLKMNEDHQVRLSQDDDEWTFSIRYGTWTGKADTAERAICIGALTRQAELQVSNS